MPTLEASMDVDFELFCGECGAGICNNASYRKSHNRGAHQYVMEGCSCLKDRIKELEKDAEYWEAEYHGSQSTLRETENQLRGAIALIKP